MSIGSTRSEGSKSTGQTPSAPSNLNMDSIQSARTNPNMSLGPSTARSEKKASGDDDVERGRSVEMTTPQVDLIIEESDESEEKDSESEDSEQSSESDISEDNDSEDSSNDE